MNRFLRREVLIPGRADLVRALAITVPVAVATSGVVALALLGAGPPPPRIVIEGPPPAPALERSAAAHAPASPAVTAPPTGALSDLEARPEARPGPDDFAFVFPAGDQTYMALAELDPVFDADTPDGLAPAPSLPRHGALRLAGEQWSPEVVAEIALEDVPAEHRRWHGRTVLVDGGCRARVVGFAVVARLHGDVAYSMVSDSDADWTAETAFAAGAKSLAARLEGCHGSFARDAALAPVEEALVVEDPRAVARARADFLGSAAAAEAEEAWSEAGYEGRFWEGERGEGAIDARVLRHPRTGAVFVAIHARLDEGCGGPDVNLFGLYRVNEQSQVTRAELVKLDNVSRIERFLDVDGDGSFELLARDWLGLGHALLDARGNELTRLSVPFYGCPC